MTTLLLTDYALFFGRFHPLVVHLPIGILLLATVLEWWPGKKVKPAAHLAWGLGAAAAVLAALLGWLLATDGGYGGDTLFWHRWLGVSVAALSVLGFFLTRKSRKINRYYGLLVAGLLAFAGHQGGNLTHGEAYLWAHAPGFVQQLAGHAPSTGDSLDFSTLDADQIPIYATFIQPVLDQKCVQCHNDAKQNGGLRMDTPAWLFEGSDHGQIVSPGQAIESTWMQRVTLPRTNAKSMPPQGNPLSFTEISLLEHWIEAGADTLATLDTEKVPEDLKKLLFRDYGLDLSPKTFVEKLKVAQLADDQLVDLGKTSWAVNRIVAGQSSLEVKALPGQALNFAALDQLAQTAAEQVVWLSLEDQQLGEHYDQLSRFPNLNRLKLNGSDLKDKDLAVLKKLPHLESLNLYGTTVSDAGLKELRHVSALKRLYLWQTDVTPAGVEELREALPELAINVGFRFAEDEEETSKR